MAKQNNTSPTNTNTFLKGMIKDYNASFQPSENWSHAINAANNSVDGDLAVIGNEPANLLCGQIPYTIIGAIHKQADQWFIFSTDDSNSEIGLFDDSTCQYTTIVNAPCLEFNRNNLITGAAKENYDCTWQIYWDDNLNPSRTLNVDDIPWIQNDISTPGSSCKIYENTDQLNCEKLRLAPLVETPCIYLSKAQDGGQLRNGTYQAYIAYVVNEQKVTDYIGVSNLQSLFNHSNNAGSLNIEISNLDQDFEFFELVILSNNQSAIVAKKIGIYSTQQTSISIDYIDPALVSIPFEFLFALSPAYEKSEAMYVVNDWLIRQGPTEQFDFNYQPIANQIRTEWVVAEYPANYYHKGGNKTGFLRDEVYSFFIRWVYNTGERSSSYHIPGRAPVGNELDPNSSINSLDGPNYNFEVYNTATVSSLATSQLDDGGVILSRGDMAYWQSTEEYPATKPEIWNSTYVDANGINIGSTTDPQYDLCGKKIRHHKMPTEETDPTLQLSSSNGDRIRILGVQFSNIGRPKFNNGIYIPNIVGYEILRGSREGAKSIIAKGVFRNLRKYNIPDNTTSLQGLYPNYPYNDLNPDIYFHDGSKGRRTDGCHPIEESIKDTIYPPLKGYTKDVFTFHSPELMFKRPYLNSYEARLYGELNGISTGNFIASELHPQNKLLRNSAVIIGAIIGIGYALRQIQGLNSVEQDGIGAANIVDGAGDDIAKWGAAVGTKGLVKVLLDIFTNTGKDFVDLITGNAFSSAFKSGTRFANIETIAKFKGLYGAQIRNKNEADTPESNIPEGIRVFAGAALAQRGITQGSQEVIDLMYNLIKESDFAFKHNSHGELFNYIKTKAGNRYRSKIKEQNYIGSSFQVFDGQYKINNLFRPDTVVLGLENEFEDPITKDISRYVVGGGYTSFGIMKPTESNLKDPGITQTKPISMHYGALKFNFQNQYGQLDGIKQVPMRDCVHIIDPNQNVTIKLETPPIFSGDTYVGRYTEKVIMPIFTDFLLGQPNEYTYDYLKRVNIPYPRFWMNTQKYDTSKGLQDLLVAKFSDNAVKSLLPNDLFYLDRGTSCINSIGDLFKGTDGNPAFAMRYAYMYTHVNGILDFFTESEINLAQRDWDDTRSGRYYDPYNYNNVDDLFHSEIIKQDNFYKYDYSLSASRFVTNLTSFGLIQPRDYNPQIAETCFTNYPKRLIYSLQAQEEAKKDFWRVFLPNNYKDFKDRVSVIKPVNKSGALIFFAYQSPQMFQGLDQLETDLGTKLTIGDGGLFSQPFQNIVNSDLPNEYGSLESARSVINTPSGLFYISQAQGKIFQYAGQLENIANRGMKWWFNKYLPSVLIRQFPELEQSILADNPVIGIGCQSIYDITDDIVYFCKKDYAVKDEYLGNITFNLEQNQFYYTGRTTYPIQIGDPIYFDNASWTVSYDPKSQAWISFHDWHPELSLPSINHFLTTKTLQSQSPYCPPGYNYNAQTGRCERLLEESAPAIVTVDEVEATITGTPGNYTCNCPSGYTLIYPDSNTLPVKWTEISGTCSPTTPPQNILCDCYVYDVWANPALNSEDVIITFETCETGETIQVIVPLGDSIPLPCARENSIQVIQGNPEITILTGIPCPQYVCGSTPQVYAPICRKVTCECPEQPYNWAPTTQTGECDNLYLAGPNGDPNYVNQNPVVCNYFRLDERDPSFTGGTIWRHNYRCDLFSNYYGVNYPWEVEFIETTGQNVTTLRSVEYLLESYVYKGDLINGCGDDRWHDLDFNFDEATIYNTEQVSGLLRLDLNPKEDPYRILQYPIIGANDIKILYSKEEQKYRFNQFWDITNDRGEFSNSEQRILITQLNGYQRVLNTNNLDYAKEPDQRKKFRHYLNKLILRRRNSGNRKMLLKLANTKLNVSFR